jgi:hypothetical protein
VDRISGGHWHDTPKHLRPLQSLLGKLSELVTRYKADDDEWWLKLHEDRLVTLIRRHGSDSGPATTARADIATRLEQLGRFDEARLLREEVVAAHRRNRGEDDLHTLIQEEWLVRDLWALGEREQARDLAVHIHQVRSRDQGVAHKDTLRAEALLRSIDEG